ncbi:Electron transfer flavoprotein subunit alpha [Leptospira interrogans serovar Manilae]|uniref:Electron transfer flavoprotein subunit alpha n=1 Tax=Leptospira interrogans serovar Manilae TaxID=214675 RepID=A0AAQ1P3G8_LEPIR|nr:electron transfer flavoprotein subunit alpha/FixB family protein [Leptospira interrogans]AKP27274.1 electron transfer flavoprotein subunit alpha [Leptospira interrogans serovar Manilae]AKP31044.1 electron transfer flavoprotein subunit alpha [Leptospira interrogans serovar Manilae]EYU64779.1 electron transfer flavoprotein subunit alpha [Leptospira interrogans serovar Manilae]SOR63124.1 Electron transfer flavoprotein subunit alpha [Leptospira interrogans serovar Manilae]
MSNVFIVGELKDGELKKISREITSAGRKIADSIGGKVIALLIGNGVEKHAPELAAVGADTILTVNSGEYNAETYSNQVAEVIKAQNPAVVLLPHTSQGKDYSPRVAVKVGAGIIADVVGFSVDGGKVVAKKPIYSGKAYANFKVTSPIQIFTVRPNSQEITQKAGAGAVEAASPSAGNAKVKIVSSDLSGGSKVQLTEASIIVSGGRGIKGPENWPILQELADTLGAALGASRAAVDAGWISHSHQVGQTGKTVSPNCYIACGISGAIQHLAGMGSSKYIVAINKDGDAPIFKVATYGIVGDLFEVVPAVTAEFKKVLG